MAKVQKQFKQFAENIRLGTYDENQTLRDKRDIIVDKLRTGLKKNFADKGKEPPKFESFNQGSYAMNTGIKPVKGDYDIDVGIRFFVSKVKHTPLEVKQWVYDALEDHTSQVEIRRNCVTVYYIKDGEVEYHVDLAVYAAGEDGTEPLHLAKGKANSNEEFKFWEEADPQGLIEKIKGVYTDDDAKQYRRSIRALKRWKQEQFNTGGNGAPVGIGLTLAAYYWFQVSKVANWQNAVEYDDRAALQNLVRSMLNNFSSVYHQGEFASRLVVKVPVKPDTDVFVKMTNTQMNTFKANLEALEQALIDADNEPDTRAACLILRKQFGEDFPVPPEEETAKQQSRSVVGSSSSA